MVGYVDLKMTVIFKNKNKTQSQLVEIQFVLNFLLEAKKFGHTYCAIERKDCQINAVGNIMHNEYNNYDTYQKRKKKKQKKKEKRERKKKRVKVREASNQEATEGGVAGLESQQGAGKAVEANTAGKRERNKDKDSCCMLMTNFVSVVP